MLTINSNCATNLLEAIINAVKLCRFPLQNRMGGNNRASDEGAHVCEPNDGRVCMGSTRGNDRKSFKASMLHRPLQLYISPLFVLELTVTAFALPFRTDFLANENAFNASD